MTKRKKPSRLSRAILAMAHDMRQGKIISETTYTKITQRHLDTNIKTPPIKATTIRSLRKKANMSQAAFAHYLNLTTGYVSQLERGVKQPTGAALVLLHVVRHKGIDVVLESRGK